MKKLAIFLFINVISVSIFASNDCTPIFKENREINACDLTNYASMIFFPISTYLFKRINNGRSYVDCPKPNKRINRLKIARNIPDDKNCKLVKELKINKGFYIAQDENKCELTLHEFIKRGLKGSGNILSISNYSKNCIPRDIKASLYCCK